MRNTGTQNWIEDELSGLDLGDEHLNKRAKLLMSRPAAKSRGSVSTASNGWSETIAAYRFLGNDEVDWQDILAPHWAQTVERMRAQRLVLCLQNTTELDFNGQQTRGLGPLKYQTRRGMYLHPTDAVTPGREPLEVVNAWMWARASADPSAPNPPPKESTRWIESYERLAEVAAELPQTQLVDVADREADMVSLITALGQPTDRLVRAKHNRCLPDGGQLWARTASGAPLGEFTFTMASRRGVVKARKVRQHLWARSVHIPAEHGQTVSATCIIPREVGAPDKTKPLEWRLLANREETTAEALTELIDWYRARWEIEMFFNILKNGCRIEALQFSAVDRLERAIALFMVVAWRMVLLMRTGRTCPELEATLFFDADEINGAYLLSERKPPKTVPTINEVLRLTATLGGFLARKGDGEPGAKTIWLSLQRMMDAATTIKTLRVPRKTSAPQSLVKLRCPDFAHCSQP